jgi:uncharacterized damage-inducible protein DinB
VRGPIDHLRRLFEWNARANRATFDSLAATGGPPGSALEVMAHLLASESLWLDRLAGHRDRVPVWPEWDVTTCRDRLDQVIEAWTRLVPPLEPAGLDRRVEYVNSNGERRTDPVEDILLHVIAHSAYHRGQIAMALRACDEFPVSPEDLEQVRQRLVE